MPKKDNFINIPFTFKNLDRYYIRMSIFSAIRESLSFLKGKLLDAGCGQMPYRKYILENSNTEEYIGLDIDGAIVYNSQVQPDYRWDGIIMPFENNTFDSAIATEVLEHCPKPELFLAEVYRVLKPGSHFFITVPFLWNLHEVPHDEYRYTPFALERLFKEAGFQKIQVKALGGWNASLGQMMGLWLKRSGVNPLVRLLLTPFFFMAIHLLIKTDHVPVNFHQRPQMCTSFSVLAIK